MWGNLGNACWFIAGRRARAEEALRRAIGLMRERLERHPTDADAWSRLGGWLGNLNDAAEATRHMERALELAPGNVHIMVNAGQLYAQLGCRDRALHWLEQAVQHGYGAGSFARSPLLASLRGDPEFERILASSPWPSGSREVPERARRP
jgi:Flp pilus assembly protein TadD